MTAKRKSVQDTGNPESILPIAAEADSDPRSLNSLAESALRGMILDGKISAGNLIKVLGLENPAAAQAGLLADFAIHLKEE